MSKVYKLVGEAYEITEENKVYSSKELALVGAKAWEDFLDMTVEEALETGDLLIEEWDFERCNNDVSKDIADELAKALEYADSALFMRGVLRTGTIRTRIHLALAKYKSTET